MEMVKCNACNKEVEKEKIIPIGSDTVCIDCKDIHVQRLKEGVSGTSDSEFERIREEHLTHETNLKGIGALILIGGVLSLFGAIGSVAAFSELGAGAAESIGVLIGYFLVSIVLIWIGIQYRKLNPAVRIPGTIIACIGLLSVPIGTLINGFVLYLIHSKKGKTVLSKEYQEIVAATPHIKYKTSKVAWAVLIILIVVLVLGVVVAVNS